MPYPCVKTDDASHLIKLYQQQAPALNAEVINRTFERTGADFDRLKLKAVLEDLLEYIEENCEQSGWQSLFEVYASSMLYEELDLIPEIAADKDFWTWIVFAFDAIGATIVDYRYGKQDEPGTAAKGYYGLNASKENLFNYLWLRAHSIRSAETETDVITQKPDVDFWKSHIVRIDYGCVNSIARAFCKFVDDEKLPRGKTNDADAPIGFRDLASELTRRNATFSFELMDEPAAYEFIDYIWGERDKWAKKV